jgi:hypothetical protein
MLIAGCVVALLQLVGREERYIQLLYLSCVCYMLDRHILISFIRLITFCEERKLVSS